MKIDITAVITLIGLVLPGLLAQRARQVLVPRSFDTIGPTEELAQFAGYGLSIHLGLFSAYFLFFAWFCHAHAYGVALHADFLAQTSDQFAFNHHWFVICYLVISLAISYPYGLCMAVLSVKRPFGLDRLLLRLNLSPLDNRPLLFSTFWPDNSDRVFLEIEMKDNQGFFSGQLLEYGLVPDEEPHKPVVLIKTQFKALRSDSYTFLSGNKVLIDLADAVSVQILRVDKATVDKD